LGVSRSYIQKAATVKVFVAGFGWMAVAVACGAISVKIFPEPFFSARDFRGISLILAPLITGAVMKLLGDRQQGKGKPATLLATFWGGSAFAFVFSLTRFLLLRSK
jgi:hypothetical protein